MLKAGSPLRRPFQAPRELRQAVSEIGSPRTLASDAVLFRQGAPVKGVFLVQSGKVALSLRKAKVKKAWVADTGSLLGLPATVRKLPYSLTAKAVEDTSVVFVGHAKMRRLLLTNPKLCFQAVRVLGAELRSIRLQQ